MLATPWIILIAVVASLVSLAVAAGVHLRVQRKRNRKYLANLNQDLTAYHRTRLSAYDNNYAHVGHPPTQQRAHAQQGTRAGWPALDSQERLEQEDEPAQLSDDSPMPPKAKRKKSLRDSLYGHSGAQAPKTRRQKKIAKAISMKDMPRSPLSAITEMTDTTEIPSAVELPTERTPRVTPERDGVLSPAQSTTNWSLPVNKKRSAPMSPVEIETPISLKREPSLRAQSEMPRSASKQSNLSEAPDDPLPPLPNFDTHKSHSLNRRQSQMSTDTVGSSVLGPAMSSPDLNLPFGANSGMQDFDFGFTHRSSPRVGPSPGRMTALHSGTPGVASITPSFDFHGRQWSNASAAQPPMSTASAVQPPTIRPVKPDIEETWSPTAEFFFGSPNPVSNRHSMLDYSLSARSQKLANDQRQLVGNVSPTALPPRPASVASSNPWKASDRNPLLAGSRLSSGSTGSGKRRSGHKRQNCVRISIPINTRRRPSNISELVEDSDDEVTETPRKVQIVDASSKKTPLSEPRAQVRRSIVDENGSPTVSPISSRPILVPSKPKPTASYGSRNAAQVQPASDVFYSAGQALEATKPKTPDPFANPDRWALVPTPPSAVTLNVSPFLGSENDSPTLPSPIAPLKISSSALTALPQIGDSPTRKTRLLGPRSPPSVLSTNVHLQTSMSPPKSARSAPGTSLSRPAQAAVRPQTRSSPAENDLRKSVTRLRSMDTNGRQLNAKSGLYSSTNSFMSQASSRNNHDDWKELNAIWEVSRPNSIDSVSIKPVTRDNSFTLHSLSTMQARRHQQSQSHNNVLSQLASPTLSSEMSDSAPSSTGYGMQQGSVNAGGGYLPRDSNPFSAAPGQGHNRQPSMFGSSKRKMSMSVSHGQSASQGSNMNFSGNSTSVLRQSATWGQFGHISRTGSPSRMSTISTGGVSIWEDESIRGDSPEPLSRKHSVAQSTVTSSAPGSGPGPALPTIRPVEAPSKPPQGLGITTSVPDSSKPRPIIFDDAYSVSHLVSPLNDSDLENMTPINSANPARGSAYTFNFPAVPTGKRVPSRGQLGQPQPQPAVAAEKQMPVQSKPLTPQPLRSHQVLPSPTQQQQRPQTRGKDASFDVTIGAPYLQATPRGSSVQQQGMGLRVGDKLMGTPGSLRSLYDGDGFLRESPLRNKDRDWRSAARERDMQGVRDLRGQMVRGEGVGWRRDR